MPARRGAQVAARPLDDAPFGEEGLYPRKIAAVAKQCSQQAWLVSGGGHRPIVLQICISAWTKLMVAQRVDDDGDQHDHQYRDTYPDRESGQVDAGIADRCL